MSETSNTEYRSHLVQWVHLDGNLDNHSDCTSTTTDGYQHGLICLTNASLRIHDCGTDNRVEIGEF